MFWKQIAANKRASFLLHAMMVVLLAGVGAAAMYVYSPDEWYVGAIAAFAAGALIAIGLAAKGDRLVLSMSGAREATHEENQMLVNVGHEMSIAAGIPAPRMYVIEDSAPNAFATGMSPKTGVICVTAGLLDTLDRQELQGVVAHEMAHIRNYDIRLMTTLAVTVGLMVLVRDFFFRCLRHGGLRRRGKGEANAVIAILAILFILLAPLFATLLKLAVSRKREFLADATAAQLTRYPDGLADALQKIAADREELEAANNATAHMYIVNPIAKLRAPMIGLLSTHPPTEERIRRLRAMGFRGHDRPQEAEPEGA